MGSLLPFFAIEILHGGSYSLLVGALTVTFYPPLNLPGAPGTGTGNVPYQFSRLRSLQLPVRYTKRRYRSKNMNKNYTKARTRYAIPQEVWIFLLMLFMLFMVGLNLSFRVCNHPNDVPDFTMPFVRQKNMEDILPSKMMQPLITASISNKTGKDGQYKYLQKVFRPLNFTEHNFPCFPAESNWWHPTVVRSPTREGIFFVRNMKTASSTIGGIAIRIARSVAKKRAGVSWLTEAPMCKVRFDHASALEMQYDKRDKNRSFMFSFVRDPTKRIISEFFHFAVSREKIEPTDENFQRYILKSTPANYYVKDMTLLRKASPELEVPVRHILNGYDFIGITERMHESLVVLKILLSLNFRDILYISSKSSGGYDDGASSVGCVYIMPSFVSPGMNEFFSSKIWKKRTHGDNLLYQAALHSLDATIDSLGREEVEQQVRILQRALEKADKSCSHQIQLPCSPGGQRQLNHSCIWWDTACGYECLDELSLEEFGEYLHLP